MFTLTSSANTKPVVISQYLLTCLIGCLQRGSHVFIILTQFHQRQWRIQNFPQGGAPTPKITIIFQIFAENCMKMKEFGPPRGHASLVPPLDLPMNVVFFFIKREKSDSVNHATVTTASHEVLKANVYSLLQL